MANSQVALQGNTRVVLAAKELFKPVAGLFFLAEKSKCKYITGNSLTRLIYFATDAVRGLAPGDDPADDAALPPDAVAVGGAKPLPLQPTSAPSPSSAVRVSVIVLIRVCRRVRMSK